MTGFDRARDEPPERPACGSGHARGSYNTPLHVAALVIILVLSTLACSFPIIVRRFPKLPVPHHVLFLSRHFGTGVLIATAFVHLLPTAFVSLTDPCLPAFWNKGYPAMAGLIALVSVFLVVSIEMFFATRGAGHMHGGDYDTLHGDETGLERGRHGVGNGRVSRPGHQRQESLRRFRQGKIGSNGRAGDIALGDLPGSSENLMAGVSPLTQVHPPSPDGAAKYSEAAHDDSDQDLDLDELDPAVDATELWNEETSMNGNQDSNAEAPRHNHPRPRQRVQSNAAMNLSQHEVSELQEQRKMLLQCLLLEAGILFHSVFIGMALSVATGTSFIVLLVAISFHQTFEGLALGARIAAIPSLPPTSPKPWLMALAYGTTTPLGQAIGLLLHNLYDPASQAGLLTVGVMNAISSGLLLFAGLVELLAEDFLSDKSYEVLRGRRRLEACGSVAAGGALMALVGAWA
ncbi:MAG: hypothetical protein M1833_002571 [Piccolia ochrophora]|nr:MAG: hypothetical protein M1833_002571 [Piccolia ochrophora]